MKDYTRFFWKDISPLSKQPRTLFFFFLMAAVMVIVKISLGSYTLMLSVILTEPHSKRGGFLSL